LDWARIDRRRSRAIATSIRWFGVRIAAIRANFAATMDASKIIDEKIASIRDWRGERMKAIRAAIRAVDPQIVEEWKWMGTPVWNHNGIVCIANAHKQVVKVTFHKGAQLADPQKLFNNGLGGNKWRAIDYAEGDPFNAEGFKGLVRAAIALNGEKPAGRKAAPGASAVTAKKKASAKAKPASKKAPATKKAPAAAKKPLAKKPVIAKKPVAKKK
jgi:hypothetical protein